MHTNAPTRHRNRHRYLPKRTVQVVVHQGLYLQGWLDSASLTGRGGILHHVYLQHGSAAGLVLLDSLQRLTTSASLYAYCVSVGLNDCLLRPGPRDTGCAMITQAVEQLSERVQQEKAGERCLPYRVEECEQIVRRLIAVRAPSEAFVVDHVLRSRLRRPADGTAMTNTNQIALLCMLGTKGSVSNLVQCTHALGQQIIHDARVPVGDFGRLAHNRPFFVGSVGCNPRVFPHDRKHTENVTAQGLLTGPPSTRGHRDLAARDRIGPVSSTV